MKSQNDVHEANAAAGKIQSDPPALVDPVCKMTVTAQSQHSHVFENRPYYFCSAGCKSKFVAQPSNYLEPAKITVGTRQYL